MYPPGPNKKNQHRSMFRDSEAPIERRSSTSECFQQQATSDLSGPSPARSGASKCAMDSANDALPSLTITSGSKITSEVAATASGSTDAIKGMNADTDQVKQMMALNATPELFDELKNRDRKGAADLAVSDTTFQRQALHGTDDEAFAQEVRLRIGGGSGET
ncbi:MAG TPA: hypothetical protein V6C89_00145 [Drouetiella sp.]|jgi:hypothetical protein